MQNERLKALLEKYLDGTATDEEKAVIDKWYREAGHHERHLSNENASTIEIRDRIFNAVSHEITGDTKVVPIKRNWKRIVAAASVILIVGSFAYLAWKNLSHESDLVISKPEKKATDVAPPTNNRATLQLNDGTKIILDSSGNGTLAIDGNVNIEKKNDGLISYTGQNNHEISYNTLSVPRGSKPMKLQLSDGTQVWLNVSSSITYPVAFAGSERKVEINGEAYFEVAKDLSKPFVVKKANDDLEIKVLGTHFNVNSYDDELEMKVTLLEGSVQVYKDNQSSILRPGHQAQIKNNIINVSRQVDLEEVMAWKEGRFYFDGASINAIMRQVEKWYDVKIKYETSVNSSFVAKISRDVNVSQLLNIFETTDLVHFKIEGNEITVIK